MSSIWRPRTWFAQAPQAASRICRKRMLNGKSMNDMKNSIMKAVVPAMAVLLLAGCSRKEMPAIDAAASDEGLTNPVSIRFDVGFEAVKTSVGQDGKCSWTAGDRVAVYCIGEGGTVKSAIATIPSDGPSASISVTIEDADTYYAVYPASVQAVPASDGTVSITIPSVQDGTFANASICAAVTSKEEHEFSFKHAVSLLKFTTSRTDVAGADMITKDGKAVGGTVVCSFSDSGISVGTGSETSVKAAFTGAGTYYLAVAPGVQTAAAALRLLPTDSATPIPAANVEPAAGLDFQRAKISNLGNVDSHIATDLYISADGTGNGLSQASPAPYSLLSTMAAAKDVFSNRLIAGTTFHILEGTCTATSVISMNPSEACPFTVKGEGAAVLSGGGTTNIFKLEGLAGITLDALTIKSGKAAQGGALYMNGGKLAANGCTFSGNTATSAGGVIYATSTSDVTFNNCSIVSNSCTGTSSSPSVAILWGNAFLKCNGCYFGSNTAANRAVINAQGTSVVFINGCAFNNNSNTAAGTYASVIHAGNAGVCINNSTFYQNNKKESNAPLNNCESITAAANMIITNSTFYEYFQANRSVIACTAAKKGVLFNDVILNNYSGSVLYFSSDNYSMTSYGHNIYRSITDYRTGSAKVGLPAATGDVSGISNTVLGDGKWDSTLHTYTWNGTLASGTLVKATPSEFETAVKAMTETVSNTVVGSGTKLGTAFWDWLASIAATNIDQLGTNRGSAWWPGAYQGE